MSCCHNVPGDVVISDPQETDIISPVIDQRPRTAVAGPGGGAPQLDEGRPGELSYLRILSSDNRSLRKVKIFLLFISEYFYLKRRGLHLSTEARSVKRGQTSLDLTHQQREKYQPHG